MPIIFVVFSTLWVLSGLFGIIVFTFSYFKDDKIEEFDRF